MLDNKIRSNRARMESEYDGKQLVVIDNGADTIKIGISGDNQPRLIIDSVVGEPQLKSTDEGSNQKQVRWFGEQLKQKKIEKKYEQTEIKEVHPIEEGKIKDFDVMKELWKQALDQGLQVNEISSTSILMIDSPFNSKEYKNEIAQILFDDMKVNSVLFMNSSTLSLFATGSTTGLVVESGHSVTSVVPVFEGYPITHAFQRSFLAGDQITQVLQKELEEKPEFQSGSKNYLTDIVKHIKQSMCRVSLNYATESDLSWQSNLSEEEVSYELPDNTILKIDNQQRYKPCEIMFDSKILENNNSMSIPDMIVDSLKRCDEELQSELYSNIVLCGGSSLFKGFQQRIEKDLLTKLPPEIDRKNVNFPINHHSRYSAWIGGSMLGSLKTFQDLQIRKGEYEEVTDRVNFISKHTF